MADQFTGAMTEIIALHDSNAQLVAKIKAFVADVKIQVARSIRIDTKTRTTIIIDDKEVPTADILRRWKPLAAPLFVNTAEMNLFNDPIDYTVASFADLGRLNDKLHAVAAKYEWVDPMRVAPILAHFQSNLGIIHDLLDQIEALFKPPADEWIDTLKANAAELETAIAQHADNVASWNAQHATTNLSALVHTHIWDKQTLTGFVGGAYRKGQPCCKGAVVLVCSCNLQRCNVCKRVMDSVLL